MVGWVSARPMVLADVLGAGGLAELTVLSRQHADGWGLAWWDGDVLRRTASQQPAHSCADYARAVHGVRADAAVLHLRWATPGLRVRPENTHPFVVDDWAFGHNGAVRPADGLLDLLPPGTVLEGDTDSERLLHVLLDRIAEHELDAGLRRTVADVCADLTPTSLNAVLLGRDDLVALCSHAGPGGDPPPVDGPPEDQPGYFDLRWRRSPGLVVVASEPLGDQEWQRLDDGTALVVDRADLRTRTVDVGRFPAAAAAREVARRASLGTPPAPRRG